MLPYVHLLALFVPLSTLLAFQHTNEWIASLITLAVTFVLWRLAVAGIERFYARRFVSRFIPRVSTYRSLTRSVMGALVFIVLVFALLHIWSVNVTPALWSATVISAVLAFGSQALVRDVLTGVFFFFEDTYDVGDVVEFTTTNGNVSGTVDAVGLRVSRIIDERGRLVSIPNGSVVFVTNSTRRPSRVSIKITVPLRGGVLELRQRVHDIGCDAATRAGIDPNTVATHVSDSNGDSLTFDIEFEVNRAVVVDAESTMRAETLAGLQAAGILPGAKDDSQEAH